jgi:hydrogenase maturation protein HypF
MNTAPHISDRAETGNGIESTCNWHIHLQGRVQGVGFRPYVYNLATQWKLPGKVQNGLDGLHVWLYANEAKARAFYDAVLENLPRHAIITHSQLVKDASEPYIGFTIKTDAIENKKPNLWITPDLATCSACLHEMQDAKNKRHQYAFISCTHCGPRYSIMKALPFERQLTTMQPFHFCTACRQEFNRPADRLFFAQTMSCKICGIEMAWMEGNGNPIDVNKGEIISVAAQAILQGKIVAVKGIGGYLLLTDATNEAAIVRLRTKKHRPDKPLAVMYPSLKLLQQHTTVTPTEKDLLISPQAPIVLLPVSQTMQAKLATEALAPDLDKLGVMLPYAPLLHLLANACSVPVVATSGNVSGAPVCFTDTAAETQLKDIADYFLMHNRLIITPQDDSLVCVPAASISPILLRRSRGYAPACENYKPQSRQSILATGALIKSTFALSHAQRVYVSQYLGNTDSYEAQLSYRHTCNHLLNLLHMEPQVVVADKHPGYFAHDFARQVSAAMEVPLHTVQHHKAHFAAVLAENNLLDVDTPLMGVIWDSTGLGEDGQSWGGEFFTYEQGKMDRRYYFDYFPRLLGDKMAREPRLAAMAALHNAWPKVPMPGSMFSAAEEDLYQRMLHTYEGIQTSSVGRLFDAAAALVLGMATQTYEGQAAMRLEAVARQWLGKNELSEKESYFSSGAHYHRIPTATLMQAIALDVNRGCEAGYIAAKFHRSLVHLIEIIAGHLKVQHVAFSGGVFQNGLLVDMIWHHLGSRFTLFFHRRLPPNDENISFGQLVWVDRLIS